MRLTSPNASSKSRMTSSRTSASFFTVQPSRIITAAPARSRRPPRLARRRALGGQVRFEPPPQLRLGHRADETVDLLAATEEDQERDALGAVARRDLGRAVDVQLDHLEQARELTPHALDDRADHAARPAPLGPEVDEHRDVGVYRTVEFLRIGVDDPRQRRLTDATARDPAGDDRDPVLLAAVRASHDRRGSHDHPCAYLG